MKKHFPPQKRAFIREWHSEWQLHKSAEVGYVFCTLGLQVLEAKVVTPDVVPRERPRRRLVLPHTCSIE